MDEGGKEFVEKMGEGKVFGLYGKMGGGKRRFVKGIWEEVGVEDVMRCGRLGVVKEYRGGEG